MLVAWIAFADTLQKSDFIGLLVTAVGMVLVYRTRPLR